MLTKKEILQASPINVGGKEEVPEFKRSAYQEIIKVLNKSKLNIAITGLRRVGKTTLIKQILNDWDGDKFYFSFDEPIHQNYQSLKRVVEVFIEEGEKPLIALDEISKIPGWSGLIKRYYDMGKARFIVSGSSSLSISKGKESLAGRIFETTLPPLQYNEFIKLKYREKTVSSFSEIFKRDVKNYLEEFFSHGTFPELLNLDQELAERYVKESVISKIVFEDIPEVFNIEYKSKLYELFLYIVEYSGNLIHESSVGDLLGLNKGTVKEYLFYLEQAFLSYIIFSEGSLTKRLRKTKKAYVSSPVLYQYLSITKNEGQLAEISVFDKILATKHEKPLFYRDNQKREVDFLIGTPIEVKFRNHILKRDLNNLLYYMKKHDIEKGIVITRDYLDEREFNGKVIVFVPLHVFLSLESFQGMYIDGPWGI